MTYQIILRSIDKTGTTTNLDITDDVDTGFSVVERLNEELDVGSMTIGFSERDTPYGMFDTIRILIDGSLIYSMRIGGDTVQLISKNPLIYKHELSLVEHTKILERVFISGKTFTQPIDGSTPLSMFDVVDRLRLIYPLELNNLVSTTRLFTIPSALETYLDDIVAPEFTFKDITLRQALNQVLTYVDGIARLNEDSELSIDFYNDLVDLISEETDILNRYKQQNIDFYATDMTIDALNVVSDDLVSEAIEIYPSKDAFITARSDDYIFDFLKSYIPTPKRVYSVKKIKMILDVVVTEDGTTVWDYAVDGYYEFDINEDRVLEYEKYKILDVTVTGTSTPDNYSQNNVLYYNYGKNNIIQSATYGLFGTGEVIENVMRIAMYEQMVADGILSSSTPLNLIVFSWGLGYNDYQYQTHYVSNNKSLRFNVDREDLTDIDKKSTLSSNQQSRIVNLEALANNTSSKINRIGNSELSLEHRCSSVSDIKNIADYTSDLFILNQKEIVFFKDYFDNKYELTRDFNRISQFIGVNSELRQWEVAEAGRSLERDLLYKEFVEIDVVEIGGDNGTDDSELLTTTGINTYLNTFVASATEEPVRTGAMITDIYVNLVPFSSNGGGNSLIFNFKLDSNLSAGLMKDHFSSQTSLEASRYVEDDGRFTGLLLFGFDKLNAPTGVSPDTYLERADLYPSTTLDKINNNLFETSNSFTVYKGIRDIIGFTLQYQQISKRPSKVILGRYFSRRNRMITEIPPTSFKLYTYDNGIKFGRIDTLDAKSGYTAITAITPTVSTTNKYVIVSHANLTSSTSSWCLTDENDKILIAVNQDGVLHNKIKFDFLNKRSGINYNY
jgi:hypothetical protein